MTRLIGSIIRIYTTTEVKDLPHLSRDRRYLFIANHQSRIDTFAVLAPFSKSQQQVAGAPIRIITARGIYYSPLLLLLKACGCYPTRKRDDPQYDAVKQSIAFINKKQNIFIFPEGKRTPRSESSPKDGVVRIIQQSPEPLTIVLIHLEWKKTKFRRKLIIHYKEAASVGTAQEIMNQIYSL